MKPNDKKSLRRVSPDITEEELLRLVNEGRVYIEERYMRPSGTARKT